MEGLVELADRFDSVIVAGACELGGVAGWDLVDLEAVHVGVAAT